MAFQASPVLTTDKHTLDHETRLLHQLDVVFGSLQLEYLLGNLLFFLPFVLAVVDVGDLAAEVFPQLLQKLLPAGLEGGDQFVEVFL